MASDAGLSRPVRPDPNSHGPNGRFKHHDDLHEPDTGDVDYVETNAAGVHDGLGKWDRLAMVVRKTTQRMKESSWAERIIAIIFAMLMTVMSYVAVRINDLHEDVSSLNREVGEAITTMDSHIGNHPNVAIEDDVDHLEQWRLDHERRGHSPIR